MKFVFWMLIILMFTFDIQQSTTNSSYLRMIQRNAMFTKLAHCLLKNFLFFLFFFPSHQLSVIFFFYMSSFEHTFTILNCCFDHQIYFWKMFVMLDLFDVLLFGIGWFEKWKVLQRRNGMSYLLIEFNQCRLQSKLCLFLFLFLF